MSHQQAHYVLQADELTALGKLTTMANQSGVTFNREFRRVYRLNPPTSIAQATARYDWFQHRCRHKHLSRTKLHELGLAMPVVLQVVIPSKPSRRSSSRIMAKQTPECNRCNSMNKSCLLSKTYQGDNIGKQCTECIDAGVKTCNLEANHCLKVAAAHSAVVTQISMTMDYLETLQDKFANVLVKRLSESWEEFGNLVTEKRSHSARAGAIKRELVDMSELMAMGN